jgi:hypothetical protein
MQRTRQWLARAIFIGLVALAGIGQATPASAAEWVQNFVPTELWSGPDATAVSFGRVPQWDYFEVVAPQAAGRLFVLAVRTNSFAFIDASAVGPSGPPPAGWPSSAPNRAGPPTARATAQPAASSRAVNPASIGPAPGFPILADLALWPALDVLLSIQHTWTLQALAATGTRLEWAVLPPEAAAAYQPSRSLIVINLRWYDSDPRAIAAVIEHEAKHVADMLAGLDVHSPAGCITTEINAFREEAKTWGELVGPAGKPNPQDDLELSLNLKLALLRRSPEAIHNLIQQSAGYRNQCHLLG